MSEENRKNRKFIAFSIAIILLSNLIYLGLFLNSNERSTIHGVERKSNGNTYVASVTYNEIRIYVERIEEQRPVKEKSPNHRILEINPHGQITWELTGLAYPHAVKELPNDHILIADTNYDRLIEVNYPDTDIVWSWEPKKINWTKVNEDWDSDHYYNNYREFDWTHLNDVDFKQYDTWDACLISLRNFNLIVEINYTAEKEGPSNNPDNILWYFGDYEDDSLLNLQHNPEYMENGNIMVSDSVNNRIIEINKKSKELVWEYGDLMRPKDADEMENGNILITDSGNNRIIEVEKESKNIVWFYSMDLIEPYEADRLENGNTLIGGGLAGNIIEVNQYGTIVWTYGFTFYRDYFYLNLLELIGIELIGIYIVRKKGKELKRQKLKVKKRVHRLIAAIALEIIFLFIYNYIITAIFLYLETRSWI